MHKSKKQRLEDKGWKIGTADEFLDLAPEESAYIDLKLRLSDSLRERRSKQNLSQQQLASLIKSSQSRVAKMEAGDPTVSLDLLVKTLLALGASDRDLAKAIAAR
jgi:ribosome-binding protein aMBF1 (putative translation factor)